METIPGHTYRISFDYNTDKSGYIDFMGFAYDSADSTSFGAHTRPLFDANEGAGSCSTVWTPGDNYPYIAVRFGVRSPEMTVTFSNIHIQDITNVKGISDDINTPDPKIQTVKGNTFISEFPPMSRNGYTFEGWSTTKDIYGNGEIKNRVNSLLVTDNIHLYSIWSKISIEKYDIHFANEFDFDTSIVNFGNNVDNIAVDTDNNTFSFTTTDTNETYLSLTKPMKLIGGYTYIFSWSMDTSDNGLARFTILTASTAEGNDSELGFYKNLQNGVTFLDLAVNGYTFTVPENRPYVVLRPGIRDAAVGTTVTYSDIYIQDITNTDNEADDVSVPNPKPLTVTENTTVSDFPTMSRNGYLFEGWSTTKDQSGNGEMQNRITSLLATENVHLYPIWSKNI